MRIAILGGSFNPVHLGHLALADEVRLSLGYDRVILVPANIPPHKELAAGATAQDRLEMLRRAASGESWLSVDDCELSRAGPSYTIDTLEYLGRKFADSLEGKLGLVIGEDLVDGFSTWKDAERIATVADIVVARRPGGSDSALYLPHVSLANAVLSVSSSEIRENIRQGKSWRYLVPDPVYRYIVGHNLYDCRTA